ncbi:YlxR family protein [Deinococcus sp. YIM 77859]|uniref:YlxR family protein n=1 Tax=Deinococcus sp. YIM 77859 TaxID=1540221 RepID=UPI000557EBD8|nr:YlxR family protein [Deinococcus sp. YIM 77859]
MAAASRNTRHVPERTCVACRRKRPQPDLVRVTLAAEGWRVVPGARTGRGAYVCADAPDCWQEKRLRRAFRADAPAISTQLQALLAHTDQPMNT